MRTTNASQMSTMWKGKPSGSVCVVMDRSLSSSEEENTMPAASSTSGAASALPPLVEPAAELTKDEVARYSRHLIIPDIGVTGQKRLKNAKVLVVGAGGLGSPALLYLAAAGVGTLGIVDFDVVDESNLQRQIIHGQSDIDKPKAESAAESVAETNPYVTTIVHNERLDNDNVLEVFRGYDLIVD